MAFANEFPWSNTTLTLRTLSASIFLWILIKSCPAKGFSLGFVRMNGKTSLLVLLAISIAQATALAAESTNAAATKLVIHVDQPGATINRNIYGQFSEHLGRCIYEGIWV